MKGAQLAIAAVALLLCGLACSKSVRHIKMHTLVAPILENYWDNGLHEWSFGAATVITDSYARITQKLPTSRGYLWNRRSVEVENFQYNATFRILRREGAWFSDKSGAGIGFWLTAQTPRHVPVSFYGMTDQFTGLGVIFDHTDHVSLLFNNGEHLNSPHDATVGTCKMSIGENWATFVLRVNNIEESVEVLVSIAGGAPQKCAKAENIKLPPQVYLGITAQNQVTSHAYHDATLMTLFPLARREELEEDPMPVYHHDVTRKEQNKWTGEDDNTDVGDESIGDGFNDRSAPRYADESTNKAHEPSEHAHREHHRY